MDVATVHGFKIARQKMRHNGAEADTLVIALYNEKQYSIQHRLINLEKNKTFAEANQNCFNLLCRKEIEVLKLMTQGWNDIKIGKQLKAHPNIIKEYRMGIVRKLRVSSNKELIDYIIAFDLV